LLNQEVLVRGRREAPGGVGTEESVVSEEGAAEPFGFHEHGSLTLIG